MDKFEHAAQFLFKLLDDIDTASDVAKGDDAAYRKIVERIQRRRFEVATTDGYTVEFFEIQQKLGLLDIHDLRKLTPMLADKLDGEGHGEKFFTLSEGNQNVFILDPKEVLEKYHANQLNLYQDGACCSAPPEIVGILPLDKEVKFISLGVDPVEPNHE